MNLDASVTRLVKLIGLQAQACKSALECAVAQDEPGTREAVDALRVWRAKAHAVPEQASAQLHLLSAQAQTDIQNDLSQIQQAQGFISAWCERYLGLAGFEQLRTSKAGRDAYLDQALPTAWDFGRDIVVFTSPDEFEFAEALRERGQKRIVAAVTCPPGYAHLPEEVVVADTTELLQNYFQHLGTPFAARAAGLKKPDTPGENEIWARVQHAFTVFLSNQKAARTFGNLWLTQGLQNLPSIADSAPLYALANALAGLPFIIIAPGPSLDKNIALLKPLKGRAVLMAAAQCAPALHKAGITPDFLVVIDPGDLVYFLDGVDTSQIDALLVGVSCNPGFFAKKFKNRIVFNANADADRWISQLFQETTGLSSSGSVSLASLHIAKYLKCGPIILVGQDLALSEGKQYSEHCANGETTPVFDADGKTLTFSNISAKHEKIFESTGTASHDTIESVMHLPGYYGGVVRTRRNYHQFHGEFEQFAQQENTGPQARALLNCTEGGAFIHGFAHIPLAQAIEKYVPPGNVGISARIGAICASTNTAARTLHIKNKLQSMKSDLQDAIRLAKQCLHIVSQNQASTSSNAKLNQLEKTLVRLMTRIPAMALPNQQHIQQALALSSDATTATENNGAAKILYQSIVQTGTEILPLLAASLEQCQAAIAGKAQASNRVLP